MLSMMKKPEGHQNKNMNTNLQTALVIINQSGKTAMYKDLLCVKY